MEEYTPQDLKDMQELLPDLTTIINEFKTLDSKMTTESGKEMVHAMLQPLLELLKQSKAEILFALDVI